MSLTALAFAAALSGQESEAIPRHCLDDNHTNRCDAEVHSRVRALLGMAPIEDEAAIGAEIYRAFFVDGYGRDMPAVSFERQPQESPKVVVYGGDGRRRTSLVSMETWETVRRRSRFAEAPPPPPPPSPPREPAGGDEIDEVVACAHAWVATFEATVEYDGTPMIRRRTEDACHDGLTMAYAFEMAALAVASLPACERLKPENHRNDVARLGTCLILDGDTIAAADLLNEKDDPPRSRRDKPVTAEIWRAWLGSGHAARIEWAGEIVAESQGHYDSRPERPDVPQFLVQRATQLGTLGVYPARYIGEAANRARIEGQISYPIGDPEMSRSYMAADYSQVWIRTPGDAWRLDSWTVDAFTRHDYPEN